MAYLIGSADTTRFSSTVAFNSGAPAAFMAQYYVGRNDEAANAIETGIAQTLDLYISSWGAQSNIKANIYDETGGGVLVESVVVPSTSGTGVISVSLSGSNTITTGRFYRLGIYTEDADPITLFSDTGGLTLRTESSGGNYTTPSDPSILGGFVSFNEPYWAIQSTGAGPSITPSDPVVDGAQATITTSGLSGAITTTIGGYSITTAGTLPNLTYTLDIASITANGPVSIPRIGDNLELSVTGTEGTATSTVATQPAAGMAVVTLAGTLANETNSLIDKMQLESGLTIAVGDILYYSTADNTSIDATGALTTDATSISLLLIQGGNATTAANGYAFTITPEAGGDVTAPVVVAPNDITLEYPFGFSGLGQASSGVQNWLALATASDAVDGSLAVSNDLGGQVDPLPAGAYVVTFTATDAASNIGTDTATLTVVEAAEPVASGSDTWKLGRGVRARKKVKARTKVSAFKV